jgi:hypothetical protein
VGAAGATVAVAEAVIVATIGCSIVLRALAIDLASAMMASC